VPGLPGGFAELLDGELRSGDSGLGEQSVRGRLVRGYCKGAAAADGRAVAPSCPGEVNGPVQATDHLSGPAPVRLQLHRIPHILEPYRATIRFMESVETIGLVHHRGHELHH
jgi:hypothetical protein